VAADQNKRRSDIALALYREKVGRGFRGDLSALARRCHVEADAFIQVEAEIAAGEPADAPRGPKLADVDAPNLPKTHPHRLVGFKVGDLGLVSRIKAHLDKQPALEALQDYEDPITRAQINWTVEETKLARLIFPDYVEAN